MHLMTNLQHLSNNKLIPPNSPFTEDIIYLLVFAETHQKHLNSINPAKLNRSELTKLKRISIRLNQKFTEHDLDPVPTKLDEFLRELVSYYKYTMGQNPIRA